MINSAPFTLLSQLKCYMIWSSAQKTSTTHLTKAASYQDPVLALSQSSWECPAWNRVSIPRGCPNAGGCWETLAGISEQGVNRPQESSVGPLAHVGTCESHTCTSGERKHWPQSLSPVNHFWGLESQKLHFEKYYSAFLTNTGIFILMAFQGTSREGNPYILSTLLMFWRQKGNRHVFKPLISGPREVLGHITVLKKLFCFLICNLCSL